MYCIEKQFVFLIGIIMVSGERWYSATVDEDQNTEHFQSNYYKRNSNTDFVPLISYNKTTELNNSEWYFTRRKQYNTYEQKQSYPQDENSQNKYLPNNTFKMSSNMVQIRNNNTFDVGLEKIGREVPLKRRVIRRKCPTAVQRENKKTISRPKGEPRFLDVFEVVEFDHVTCISSSGLEGMCLPEIECQSNKGKPMGTCADGYGVCCVTQYQCDGRDAAQTGWFTNPDFPSPSTERLSCTITVDKISEHIKQIRLDFMSFELLPATSGTCQHDQFIVSGQNVNNVIPILCGINTGQHVYVEVGDIDGPIYMTVQTVTPESRLFSIKVTQLTTVDELAAPSGCFQYFKQPQGYIESFNYRDTSDIGIARTPSYLNNLNYAICIDRAPGSCSVTYTNSKMQIVNYDGDGLPVIPPGQAGVEIFNCPSDWLLISAIRLCGDHLNDGSVLQDFSLDAPVTDTNAGPIVVWFRSDEGYVGRGFKLHFQQNACNNGL